MISGTVGPSHPKQWGWFRDKPPFLKSAAAQVPLKNSVSNLWMKSAMDHAACSAPGAISGIPRSHFWVIGLDATSFSPGVHLNAQQKYFAQFGKCFHDPFGCAPGLCSVLCLQLCAHVCMSINLELIYLIVLFNPSLFQAGHGLREAERVCWWCLFTFYWERNRKSFLTRLVYGLLDHHDLS